MRPALVSLVVVVIAAAGCIDLSPKVPDGYPALKLGDGGHGVWSHGDTKRDIVAAVGIITVEGHASLLITADASQTGPSIDLRFPSVTEDKFESEPTTDAADTLVIESDSEGTLFSDDPILGGSVKLSIDHKDELVVAGSFSGKVCSTDQNKPGCVDIADGKFSALDDRKNQ